MGNQIRPEDRDKPIVHIVMFGFEEHVSLAQRGEVGASFLALKDKCIHPRTGLPYVVSINGGKDHSPEGIANGVDVAFVVAFANDDDRMYYLNEDPAHTAFKGSLKGIVKAATVVDFTPNVFG